MMQTNFWDVLKNLAGNVGQGVIDVASFGETARMRDRQQQQQDALQQYASVLSGQNVPTYLRNELSPQDLQAQQLRALASINVPQSQKAAAAIFDAGLDTPERQLKRDELALEQKYKLGMLGNDTRRADLYGKEIGRRLADQDIGPIPAGMKFNRSTGTLEYLPRNGENIDNNGTAVFTENNPGKPLPNSVLGKVAKNIGAVSKIDRALELLQSNPDATGIIGGLVSSSGADRFADSKNIAARAGVADVGSQVIHDRSGAAVTISEMPRLKPFVPTVYDTKETASVKLQQLRSAIAQENEGFLDTYQAGGYKTDPYRALSASPVKQKESIKEGITATNPKTGQKIIFRNGQWGAL